MLGYIHILEIQFIPQMFGTNIRTQLNFVFFTYPRNMFPLPNVQHEYQDRIENVGSLCRSLCWVFVIYTSQIYVPPKIFDTNIRIELKMFGFSPPKCLARISGQKMFGFTDLLEICFHPQNVWHEYQDIIENVGFYTPPRNMFPPPKFWH